MSELFGTRARQVVGEAEQARWQYTPAVRVGLLRCEMNSKQPMAAQEAEGFDCDAPQLETQYNRLNRRAEFW